MISKMGIMPFQLVGIFRKYRICFPSRVINKSTIFQAHKLSSDTAFAEKRLVYHSTSHNIFSNLAFEEWLYENEDLVSTDILLIWQNSPSVVIGRHQNPWLEANIQNLRKNNVLLSRRSSGGGTVYHDEGNLNLSFLKSRTRYNRKENLSLVVDALTSKWDIDLKINERDDIILDGFYKISGTAAKVGRTQTYHHFTLLHSVETDTLTKALSSPMYNAKSKSTKSVPALVKNLKEADPSITISAMVEVIAETFLNQVHTSNAVSVDPENELQYPEVRDLSQRLQSWDWLYSKTPNFSINRQFSMPTQTTTHVTVEISINVEKGCVSSLNFNLSEPQLSRLSWQLTNIFELSFLNMRLTSENIKSLLENYIDFSKDQLQEKSDEKRIAIWVTQCLDVCFDFL